MTGKSHTPLSEEWLQLALEAAHVGTWEWNMQTNQVVWSDLVSALYGLSPGDSPQTYEAFLELVVPEDRESVDQAIAQVIRAGGAYMVEHRVVWPDGSIHLLSGKGQVYYDENGQPVRMLGTVMDISDWARLEAERKQAEAALKTSEQRLKRIAHATSDAIWDWDLSSNRVWRSEGFHTLFGYPIDATITTTEWWRQHVHPEEREQIAAAFFAAVNGGEQFWSAEYRFQCADGTYADVLDRAFISRDATGRVLYVSGGMQDIRDRKAAERALKQSQQQYQNLVDSVNGIVWEVDPQTFCFTFVSPQAETLLGYPAERWLMPNFWSDHLYPEDRQWAVNLCLDATQAKRDHEFEYRMIAADGRVVWLQDIVKVVVEDDRPAKLLGIMLDISERKRMEADRERAETALQQKEAQYRSIFESTTDALHIFDIETGLLVEANPAACRMHGYSYTEFLSLHPTEFVHPDSHYLFGEFIETVRAGKQFYCEAKNVRRDGTAFDIEVQGTGFTYNGKPHILSIVRDISERKRFEAERQQAEIALRQSEAKFRRAVVHAPFPIIIHTEDGEVLQINRAWTELTGYTQSDIPTIDDWTERAYGDCKDRVRADIDRLYQLDHPIAEGEYSVTTRHGEVRIWEFSSAPLGKLDDGRRMVISMAKDVTERRQAEEAIRQLNNALEHQNQNLEALVEQRTIELTSRTLQLEATNRELESFSYSVSHDLRAPLRHISGFVVALSQRLEQTGVLADAKVTHYLNVIDSSSQKMGYLIDGLLTLSRVGRRQLVYQPVNLAALVESILTRLASTVPIQGRSSVSDAACVEFVVGELPIVPGDETLLEQVFANLIDNAIKFSRRGTDSTGQERYPRIEIGTLPDGTLFVQDNGVGFQMEYADQLFGAFQRLHSQVEFEGTGIGLAIVQRIVHRHGGNIWAESQPEQGATFYFRLMP
jgi:PAS domain S-box-containing protein